MAKQPGILKVIDFITHEIEVGRFAKDTPLPSSGELAARLSVGTTTVLTAISRMKCEGVLVGVRGQRPRVAPTPGADSHRGTAAVWAPGMPQSPRHTWDGVTERLSRDIAEGVFAPNALLPKIKELSGRYKVDRRTVCKALVCLDGRGLIGRRGRGFAVPSPTSTAKGPIGILFLFYSPHPLLPTREADRMFIRALEQECLKNGVHLDCATISASSRGVVVRTHEDQRPPYSRAPDDCAGIIYLVNWADSIDERIFSWLAHSGKPLSIVDWLGGWEAPDSLARRKPVQWFRSRVNRNSGFQVGRYLALLGHKRIAFFSPYSDPRADELAAGLMQAAALAGPAHSVVRFSQNEQMSGEEFNRMVEVRTGGFKIIEPGIPPEYEEAHRRLGMLTWDIREDSTLFSLLQEPFKQALADSEITAWVGSNDVVAMMAWSYLRSHGRKIPGDISVVGFDNTFDALQHDITSYDFCLGATAGAALSFLLRPSWRTRVRDLSRPRIEGTIIQRGSTARARAPGTSWIT